MGIPTLISTHTADGDSELDITSGIDSTYDEYMFVCTDLGPATDDAHFTFQVNAASGSGFNETITSSYFETYHNEGDTGTALAYAPDFDQAQGTAYQVLPYNLGNGSDESAAGILHLFRPANTTFNKHYYSRVSSMHAGPYELDEFADGYFNTTSAINAVQFKANNGNMDCVIQMYGIA